MNLFSKRKLLFGKIIYPFPVVLSRYCLKENLWLMINRRFNQKYDDLVQNYDRLFH